MHLTSRPLGELSRSFKALLTGGHDAKWQEKSILVWCVMQLRPGPEGPPEGGVLMGPLTATHDDFGGFFVCFLFVLFLVSWKKMHKTSS